MTVLFSRFLHDECGATAVEYALIAGSLGALVFAGHHALGNDLVTALGNLGTYMKGKMPK